MDRDDDSNDGWADDEHALASQIIEEPLDEDLMPPEEVVEPLRDVEMLQPASGLNEQRLDSGIVQPLIATND